MQVERPERPERKSAPFRSCPPLPLQVPGLNSRPLKTDPPYPLLPARDPYSARVYQIVLRLFPERALMTVRAQDSDV